MGGILLGYLGSYLFVDTEGGWRIMYGASAVPALLLLAGMVRRAPLLMQPHTPLRRRGFTAHASDLAYCQEM